MSSDDKQTPARWFAQTIKAAPRIARDVPAVPSSSFDPTPQRFEEGEELGRGGMGRVFQAYDHTLDRIVAIKQALGDDPGVLARFEREVRIAARLQHPSIVPVHEAGRDAEGRPYFVMRKIEGNPLADTIRDATSVTARLALVPSVLQAIDAIAYAHSRGVIHRDLKPWNVLLGPYGETLVIDWGLARLSGEADDEPTGSSDPTPGLTRTGHAYGTPGFMAPEQARGESSDPRTDVYALGATLYHVLAGEPPFAGLDATKVIEATHGGDAPKPLPDEIPAELGAIVTKAMAADADARYRDGAELAADLRRFLTGQLVAAHRYTNRQRLARWLARHRLAVAIATATIVTLVVVGTISLRGVISARDAARAAQSRESVRADEAILERARSLTVSDPTRALALLKQLPVTSPVWLRARDVVEAAFAAGPSRGYATTQVPAYDSQLAASPHGAWFVFSSQKQLWLGVPSLDAPPRPLVELAAAPSALVWLDDSSIVALVGGGLVRIDVAHGSEHALQTGGVVTAVVSSAGRVFAVAAGHLKELDPAGGGPIADLGEAQPDPIPVTGGLVYRTEHEVMFRPDGGSPIAVATISNQVMVSASRSGPLRVAIADVRAHDIAVRELELGANQFTERGTWITEPTATFDYLGARLVGMHEGEVVWLVPGRSPTWEPLHLTHGLGFRSSLIPLASGALAVGYDQLVFVAEHRPPLELAFHTDPLRWTAIAGDYIVALTARGEVRSWRIDLVMPEVLATDTEAEPQLLTTDIAWFSRAGLLGLDLRTGATLAVQASAATGILCAAGTNTVFAIDAGIHVPAGEPTPLRVAEIARPFTSHELSHTALRFNCTDTSRMLVEVSESEITMRPLADLDTIAARLPSSNRPSQLTTSSGWIAMTDTTHLLTRVAVATLHRDALQLDAEPDAVAIADDGRVAMARHGEIAIWNLDGSQTRVELETKFLWRNPLGFVVLTPTDQLVVLASNGSLLGRYSVGTDGLLWAPEQSTTVFTRDRDGRLALVDLRDGSVAVFPWIAKQTMTSSDGETAILRDMGNAAVLVMRRIVPDQPFAMRGFVMAATNAEIDPGSTALSWH